MLNSGNKSPNIQNTALRHEDQEGAVVERVTLMFEHSLEQIDERSIQDLTHLLAPAACHITVIHTLQDPLAGYPQKTDDPAFRDKYMQERAQLQQESMSELTRLIHQRGFTVTDEQVYSLGDSNAQAMVERINQAQQDLVVLCSNHFPSASINRSHAFATVAAHISSSVLLLKKHVFGNRPAPKLLLGIDDTEASMVAVRKMGSLVRSKDANVILATVQSPVYQENAVLAPFVNQDVLDEALKSNARMLFEMATDILQAEGVQVQECKTLTGSPATELGYLAELENPDLIVVGSHNRKDVIAWLMGSVSSQLLHWDSHNLLIIR